jgi:hypothetical protein
VRPLFTKRVADLWRRTPCVAAKGEAFELSEDELAFYDALETNDSAVKVLGDETLRAIARELVSTVRANVTIDWTLRENVRAQRRVLVKRILRRHGYTPDKQEKATQTVLEQAALLSELWTADEPKSGRWFFRNQQQLCRDPRSAGRRFVPSSSTRAVSEAVAVDRFIERRRTAAFDSTSRPWSERLVRDDRSGTRAARASTSRSR